MGDLGGPSVTGSAVARGVLCCPLSSAEVDLEGHLQSCAPGAWLHGVVTQQFASASCALKATLLQGTAGSWVTGGNHFEYQGRRGREVNFIAKQAGKMGTKPLACT